MTSHVVQSQPNAFCGTASRMWNAMGTATETQHPTNVNRQGGIEGSMEVYAHFT